MAAMNNPTPTTPTLLTLPQVANRLNVSQRTVERLISRGGLPAYYIGNRRRVAEDDLAQYLQAGHIRIRET